MKPIMTAVGQIIITGKTVMPTQSSNTVNQSESYTKSVLIQLFVVFIILVAVISWQWETFHQIYIDNQVNAVGWAINGAIALLFLTGMFQLVRRFTEYRGEENALKRFIVNIRKDDDPLMGVEQKTMIAERYRTLGQFNRHGAKINHNALAATLHASESSRNSYLKFVQSVLVLTGVFGTIVSLSIALLGASDIIQVGAQGQSSISGMSTMIYGMSTALSTTMTAVLSYLIFGYFYIKLTDTQTYLISRVEEVTATGLIPHLEAIQDQTTTGYADSIKGAMELMQQFDQSQKTYADAARKLQDSIASFTDYAIADQAQSAANAETNRQILTQIQILGEMQQNATAQNAEAFRQMIGLLQEGFRLQNK